MSRDLSRIQTDAAVAMAALATAGRLEELREEAERQIALGASPADLRESIYVAALFFGFPRAVAGLAALAELDADGDTGTTYRDDAPAERSHLRDRGRELFHHIHQANADRQLSMLEELHPDFADTVIAEAYGRVLSRAFLPLGAREMIGVAVLAVLGLAPQLRAHILGARNCGVAFAEIEETVRRACDLAGVKPTPALAVIAEMRKR